jgi:hypothetical protein
MREGSKVLIMPSPLENNHEDELTAFRGSLIAATASALFWNIGFTAAWLLFNRN